MFLAMMLDMRRDALLRLCTAMLFIKLPVDLRSVCVTFLVTLCACSGPQVAIDPASTPAVVLVTPTTDEALVQVSPTPLDIPTTSYTVKRGENLTQIAERYGLTVEQLAALNGINNPNNIEVGQRIKVPRQ